MFRRILFSTAAAAALLAAGPAFAAETAQSKEQCSCCSDGSNHGMDHHTREAAPKKETARPTAQEKDAAIRMQSSLG